LKEKRAWDMAISPAKSLPMNAFMLYMSGNSVQIFSIGILVMLLLNPLKAVANINSGGYIRIYQRACVQLNGVTT
jgi:hypothetical protein